MLAFESNDKEAMRQLLQLGDLIDPTLHYFKY